MADKPSADKPADVAQKELREKVRVFNAEYQHFMMVDNLVGGMIFLLEKNDNNVTGLFKGAILHGFKEIALIMLSDSHLDNMKDPDKTQNSNHIRFILDNSDQTYNTLRLIRDYTKTCITDRFRFTSIDDESVSDTRTNIIRKYEELSELLFDIYKIAIGK